MKGYVIVCLDLSYFLFLSELNGPMIERVALPIMLMPVSSSRSGPTLSSFYLYSCTVYILLHRLVVTTMLVEAKQNIVYHVNQAFDSMYRSPVENMT